MKVYLLGITGMLGSYVYKVIARHYITILIHRPEYDILKNDWSELEKFFDTAEPGDIIINCIGMIPQRNPNMHDLMKINAIFPIKLYEISQKKHLQMIHITTNCVFSGKKGHYSETDSHDAEETYGISKSLGECIPNACIIRTSIIGEEVNNKVSLVEWIKQNKNSKIFGYTNFYWNGVTCLTLAEIILEIIQKQKFWNGVRHFYSPNTISKYDLCNIVNKVYNLNILIEPQLLEESKDMTLSSIYKNDFKILPIEEQIKKMEKIKLIL